ncbi:hypothetical protein CY35_01G138400 [Sphagnum magellanicum]|nr:hypothetical protein CY35_01G138400 [Sphagnum magellanicum]
MAEFTCALSSVRHPPTFAQTSLRHAPRSLQWNPLRRNQEFVRARAASEMIEAAQAVPHTDLTWQIAAGAIAGVAPFVVAGIEFSKRIIAQRRCNVCGGSGLVQRGEYYFRCGGCGGFLPWQSWRRFFSGR